MFAMFLGGFEVLFLFGLIPFSLLFLAFWIWMLVDAAQNKGMEQNERIVWIIVIALTHFIGALLYLIFGRPKRKPAVPV
jgi:hypothetical protein